MPNAHCPTNSSIFIKAWVGFMWVEDEHESLLYLINLPPSSPKNSFVFFPLFLATFKETQRRWHHSSLQGTKFHLINEMPKRI
jgi:hypothetical protein